MTERVVYEKGVTTMSQNKHTAIYVRVSTLDQKKGIESQIKTLKDYSTSHSLPYKISLLSGRCEFGGG